MTSQMTGTLNKMSADTKKVLFFIKSPSQNLRAIEAFLSKRNFIVHSEIEIQTSLERILELGPDFIFLSWDHPNSKMLQLPKLISESINAVIVPYVLSNTKESIRKLNICPINPKLYPPVSGPSIERLVLKSTKKVEEQLRLNQSLIKPRKNNTQEELIQVKTNLLADLESDNGFKMNEEEALAASNKHEIDSKILRQKSNTEKNNILKRSRNLNLSESSISELKNSFENKVQKPLENLLESLDSSSAEVPATETTAAPDDTQNTPSQKSGIIIQKGFQNPEGLGTTIQKDFQNPEGLGSILQKGAGASENIETYIPNHGKSENGGNLAANNYLKAFCLSVYSDNWCGYLIIATTAKLDFSTIDLVFTDWISSQFTNMQELDELDFFELKTVDQDFLEHLTKNADYTEKVKIKNDELSVSFFPVDPNKMLLELNDEQNLIKVATEDIPHDVALNFSLHLHLPENKKYILYTQINKPLSLEQKKRLIENKIYLMYTPIDHEKEYKKFMAEKNVEEIYKNLTKKLSST